MAADTATLDWSRSYAAHWRVYRINVDTWADGEPVGGVDAASVTRDCTGDAPLLESGTLSVTAEDFERGYYRIVMTAEQGGTYERVEVATLLCERTSVEHDYGAATHEAEGHSVLWSASRECVLDGSYAPAGANGAQVAARLLQAHVKAPVVVEGDGFTLNGNIAYAFGSTVLENVWKVLSAGGHTMQVDGGGRVTIRPLPTEPALVLDRAHACLLMPTIKGTLDTSGVCNAYTAVGELETVTVTNDDPASEASIASRGYVDRYVDESPTPVDGETLEAYARRRLAEESTVEDAVTYEREFWPDVRPGDVVLGSMASVGLDGSLRVQSQSIECAEGIVVSEKAAKEVRLWQG